MARGDVRRAPRVPFIAAALLAMLGLTLTGASVATAQEATPDAGMEMAATPVAGPCDAPALPPGSPTPMDDVATPEAAPVEEEAPVGTPADEAATQAATAAAQNLANCVNSGNDEAVLALISAEGLMAIFGTSNPYDILAGGFLEGATFGDFQVVGNAQTYDDGRVSVDVTYMQTPYQFVAERWFFVEDEGYWKLDGFDPMSAQPEGDTTVVGVNMVEIEGDDKQYAFEPNVSEIAQMPVIIFSAVSPATNTEPHQLAVVRLPEGVTPDQIMADPSLEEQVEFIGSVEGVAPGTQQDLALVNLEPGEYWLVCFYTSPDGDPHAADGMVTSVTVAAAATKITVVGTN